MPVRRRGRSAAVRSADRDRPGCGRRRRGPSRLSPARRRRDSGRAGPPGTAGPGSTAAAPAASAASHCRRGAGAEPRCCRARIEAARCPVPCSPRAPETMRCRPAGRPTRRRTTRDSAAGPRPRTTTAPAACRRPRSGAPPPASARAAPPTTNPGSRRSRHRRAARSTAALGRPGRPSSRCRCRSSGPGGRRAAG